MSLIALCAFSPAAFAQSTPGDTAKAPAQPAVQTDSTKAQAQPTQSASHSHKILWWTGGIALFLALNLLLSDRQHAK